MIVIGLLLVGCGAGGSSSSSQATGTPGNTPGNKPILNPGQERDIAGFLADPRVSDDVKERFIAALDDGGLDPSRFHEATSSWPVCNVVCTGRVKAATATLLTLEAMVDGREWTIGLSRGTQVSRKGSEISPSDLRPGEVVRAHSQDGVTALGVDSFSR